MKRFLVKPKNTEGYPPFYIGHPVYAETPGQAKSKRLYELQEVNEDLKYIDLLVRVG